MANPLLATSATGISGHLGIPGAYAYVATTPPVRVRSGSMFSRRGDAARLGGALVALDACCGDSPAVRHRAGLAAALAVHVGVWRAVRDWSIGDWSVAELGQFKHGLNSNMMGSR